ncbi:hemagglutinin repeat-containing protein [Mannheimia indoligenes]|uniref:hemagglutinin repeat-containing protein n=1 Tax=Mannheimia indoligenes TaxID=3103145 RepID=UPI002FE66C85
MNNIHQVIFNKSTQQFFVVSELAKSAGKPKAVSASSEDIISILQNFSEKRPLGTTDTQTNRSDNKSSSWSVGVFVGKSQGSTGFGVEGAVNVGKGHSNSDSTVQNQTEINSDSLSIKTKETTTLKGAVANINHLTLETKNLHIESVQDTEKYDSKQTQGGVSASFAWGSSGSASAQFSQNKAKVDYAQVAQQSGFNIQESAKINVEENTHLKGGIIHAEGDKANHQMTTGTLTVEAIENRSDVKVSSVSVGVSSDMSKMATSAVGAALSALGNMSESERSQTKAAISSNINLTITDNEKQKALTGKTVEETLQSLNRDTANANQAVEKADLSTIQERQEATQIVAEIGAKRVGDFAQYMGWEDGSPQKVALHGLIGYLAAKVGDGNTAATTLSAMGSEYINTEIAHYLENNTELTADQRNAIQQATAAGLGALIGVSLGGNSNEVTQSAQMALRTEKFNRQLHPTEEQRIKDLAKELAKEKGHTAEFWEQQLRLVASAMNDQMENQLITTGINAIIQDTQIYDLTNYKESLNIAYATLKNEAYKNQTIKWKDGTDVVLNGEKVYMFQSTDKQYKDNKMFGEVNYQNVFVTPNIRTKDYSELGQANGLSVKDSYKYTGELLGIIGTANQNRQNNSQVLNREYNNYVVSPQGRAEPIFPELYLIGGIGKEIGKTVGRATDTGFVFAKEAGTKIGTFAGKYPKAAEGFVVGSVSTGYDVYNGDATLEKSMMNYVLGFGLAGRSWDQQLSVNAIYKGMVSVNEKDSNEKILFGQGASATEVITGSFAESLLETGGVSGIPRQIISNVISGYIGNKIGELPQDGNKQKVEDKK